MLTARELHYSGFFPQIPVFILYLIMERINIKSAGFVVGRNGVFDVQGISVWQGSTVNVFGVPIDTPMCYIDFISKSKGKTLNAGGSITFEATQEQMADENILRELCIQKMHEILGTNWNPPYATKDFEEQVTIEPFGDPDDVDELAEDFLIGKELFG